MKNRAMDINSGVFCLVVKRLVRNFFSTRRKTKGLRSMKNRAMDINSGVFCLVVKRLVRNFFSTRRKTKGLRSMKNRGMDILFAKPPICSHVRI